MEFFNHFHITTGLGKSWAKPAATRIPSNRSFVQPACSADDNGLHYGKISSGIKQ